MAGAVRFAVVGAGVIGKIHAKAVKAAKGAALAAIVDLDPAVAREVAAEHGVPAFVSVEELIKSGLADAVTIGVPSGTHSAVGIKAARAGLHVMCEKPIDVSLRAADVLISVCAQSAVKLGCVSQSRFEPDVIAVREAVRGGRLGRMVMGEANTKWFRTQDYYAAGGWRGTWAHDGGGALMNQSIHAIDVLQWVMGPVDYVTGMTATLARQIEAEDTGVALVKFTSGALGVIQGATSLGRPQPRKHEFHGTAGTIILEENKAKLWDLEDGSKPPSSETKSAPAAGAGTDPAAVGYLGHIHQVEDLVRAITEGSEPSVTGVDARAPLELILAIYASARDNGKPVRLPLRA